MKDEAKEITGAIAETPKELDIQSQNTPDRLLELAISSNVDIEKLERLMALKERHDANVAKQLFYRAMSGFQSECVEITKDKKADFPSKTGGKVTYQYATLSQVRQTIAEALNRHGLSYRWEQTEDGNRIIITCIITHESGHSEKTTMSGEADTSGTKNSIQAKGSTYTYLQRYTLLGALGLSAQDDTDGTQSGVKASKEEIAASKKLLEGKKEEIKKLKTPTEIKLSSQEIGMWARANLVPDHVTELNKFVQAEFENKRLEAKI